MKRDPVTSCISVSNKSKKKGRHEYEVSWSHSKASVLRENIAHVFHLYCPLHVLSYKDGKCSRSLFRHLPEHVKTGALNTISQVMKWSLDFYVCNALQSNSHHSVSILPLLLSVPGPSLLNSDDVAVGARSNPSSCRSKPSISRLRPRCPPSEAISVVILPFRVSSRFRVYAREPCGEDGMKKLRFDGEINCCRRVCL